MYEGLSEKGSRFWMFIESGIRQGLSFRRIWRTFREAGVKYGWRTFLKDARIVSSNIGNWEWIRRRPKWMTMPEEAFPKTKRPTPTKYMVTFRVQLRHIETGETTYKYFTFGSDQRLSLREYEDIARRELSKPEALERYWYEVVGLEFAKAFGWRP